MEIFALVGACLFAYRLGIQDLQARSVYVLDVIAFMILLFCYTGIHRTMWVLSMSVVMIVLLLQSLWQKQIIAGVDLLLLAFFPLIMDLNAVPFFMMGLGLCLLIYHMLTQQKRAPFVTFYVLCLGIILLSKGVYP